MKSSHIEHIPLRVVKESIVRRTEHVSESRMETKMERVKAGRCPEKTLVEEQEFDFTDGAQRMSLLRAVIKDMMEREGVGRCANSLESVRLILTGEVEAIISEIDSELPFH